MLFLQAVSSPAVEDAEVTVDHSYGFASICTDALMCSQMKSNYVDRIMFARLLMVLAVAKAGQGYLERIMAKLQLTIFVMCHVRHAALSTVQLQVCGHAYKESAVLRCL